MSDIDPVPAPTPPHPRKAEREGLPPGYRMRAEPHYVDQLASRRDVVHADAPRPAKRAEAGEAASHPDRRDTREADPGRDRRAGHDGRTDPLLAHLLAEIDTIHSAAALLAGGAEPLARQAAVDAVRAYTWRAGWLLRAEALAAGTHRSQVRPRPVSGLLTQLRDGFAAECRLSGLDLQVGAADWNATVSVDEPAIVTAMSSAVFALLPFLPQSSGATIKVSITTLGQALRAIEVVQEEAPVAASVGGRFFDPAWGDRPGGWLAGLAAASVKAAALVHGGEAAFMAGARRGSTVRISFATDRVS